MKISIAHTIRNYNKKNLLPDIIAGIIIAAVSIPISMGYAQIAGLPAVYGLYGSVFPILIFSLFSTSPQFIFGVDAAPAALVGAALLTMGVEAGSEQAMEIVPIITFFTALWLILFFVFKAGKLVNYISTPVMGGFISGICCTIILMQVPKLFGGTAGTGEGVELVIHIVKSLRNINVVSLILGCVALVILIVSKKLMPKFPMAIVIMIAGAVMSKLLPLGKYGVTMLAAVEPGAPHLVIPQIYSYNVTNIIGVSLTVAVVIMAETLLAENSFAQKNGYRLNDNQEILAFALGNLAGAFTGCCPINGSVSRTTMSEQYGGKTQLTSIIAGFAMLMLLLFGTGFIGYLPVPVLTAIVISALMSAVEFHLAVRLFKVNKAEFYIFVGAFAGVLLLGTIYGVVIGIILSFVNVIKLAADPPRCFLGVLPGNDTFVDISRFKHIYPIRNVVVYRFSSNLFFANIAIFQKDIEDGIKEDTEAVILDASGIGSIDVTAAERLDTIYRKLKSKGIKFYMTEHIADVNRQLRKYGLTDMFEDGAVRKTLVIALKDLGIETPYPVEGNHSTNHSLVRRRVENSVEEYVWAYGDEAFSAIESQIEKEIEKLKLTKDFDSLISGNWNELATIDEEEWLEHLEAHIAEIGRISGEDEENVARRIEIRRKKIHDKLKADHPELLERMEQRHKNFDEQLKKHHPEVYEKLKELRENINAQ